MHVGRKEDHCAFCSWDGCTLFITLIVKNRLGNSVVPTNDGGWKLFLRKVFADLALRKQTFDRYRKIRKLCPKQRIRRIQMFDPHGMPLHPSQEIQLIEQYYTALYLDDQLPHFGTDPLTSLPFDCQEMTKALRALSNTKALAPDGIPALVWKHFVADLVPHVMNTFAQYWMGDQIRPPVHWTTGWIHLLPKPNKTPSKPQALRPICLQHPGNKILVGIQYKLIMNQAFSTLRQLPLFTYLPYRGTRNCC